MNILIIGGGGREHALAYATAASPCKPHIFAVMAKQNPGIANLCDDFLLEKETNVGRVVAYATDKKIDIAIIGPEAPLAVGLADALYNVGIPSMGPKKAVARIEFDKAWAREFMQRNNIAGCPRFGVFDSVGAAHEFADRLGDVAVKPAGLTGGKGVKVMGDQLPDIETAKKYITQIIEGGDSVVVEENLKGEEFTLQAFVDGEYLAFTPTVQDHKRAYEGDLGPNTGGMGSYTANSVLLPFLEESDYAAAKDIMRQTVAALKAETGEAYKGILYGQFMATASGVEVIEFNARFGDPEAMNILPLLVAGGTDFAQVIKGVATGTLSSVKITAASKASVCKYAVPAGYPDNPVRDMPITAKGLTCAGDVTGDDGGALLFYSSVYENGGQVYTTGSRAVAVVGMAQTITEAEKLAEEALGRIKGDLHSRHDIGKAELIQKRIDHMKELRG